MLYAKGSCSWVLLWPSVLFLSGCTFFYAHKKGDDLNSLLNVSRVKSVWQQFFDSDQQPAQEVTRTTSNTVDRHAAGGGEDRRSPAVAAPARGII